MDTQTITTLRSLRDEIRKSLKGIKASHYNGQKFGQEEEYTAKSIIGGIAGILVDTSALTKATNKFIQISTHSERSNYVKYLRNLRVHVDSRDLSQIALTVDAIKPILRNWGIRHTDERKTEFDEHINGLQKKAIHLTEYIDDVSAIKEKGEELQDEIEAVHSDLTRKLDLLKQQEEQLVELIDSTETNRSKLKTMLAQDQERSDELEDILTEAKSHAEVIDGFSKKIASREAQLEKQEISTDKYNDSLIQYQEERESYLKEAKGLIESAKQALEFKTAEGLSAAFSAQYDIASDSKATVGWLVSAGMFVVAAISVGVWTVSNEGLQLEAVIGRISLIPILIAGAWFCAGQFVKQKNIAEDYAYKNTLAKSIVGFSDQLSGKSEKGEEYSHFIKSVLSQIHNDPLRKHVGKPAGSQGIGDDMKSVLEDIKGLKNIVDIIEKQIKSGKP